MPESVGDKITLCFAPRLRGAADDLLPGLHALLRSDAHLRIASQQLSERSLVEDLADLRSDRRKIARVLLETDYLVELPSVPPARLWIPGGEREEHRQCLLGLLRAGVAVRTDNVGAALMHINVVVSAAQERQLGQRCFISSANFASGSLTKHLNWGLHVEHEGTASDLAEFFDALWNSSLRTASVTTQHEVSGIKLELSGGTAGEAVAAAVQAIGSATRSVTFAYFALSRSSRVTRALLDAAARGVAVSGVVDGDQSTQPWNGVPSLQRAGAEVLYYPGAATGAPGRMHLKSLAIDGNVAHLSSANASEAAEQSLELAITVHSEVAAASVALEVARLASNAVAHPLSAA